MGRRTLDEIRAHAESVYPDECCGLLMEGTDGEEVVRSVKMRNAFTGPKHDRYHIDPFELLRVEGEARKKGMKIRGIYHSHPDHPATLSKFDLEAAVPLYSYVIVSVPNGKAGETRSWLPDQVRSTIAEEAIQVLEAAGSFQ